MRKSAASVVGSAASADLDAALQRLEQQLDELQVCLSRRDLPGIEQHTAALQRALSLAAAPLTRAAHQRQEPLALQRRLGVASVRVAAQRDALARATAALERAMRVLIPAADSALYSASGAAQHLRSAASLQV